MRGLAGFMALLAGCNTGNGAAPADLSTPRDIAATFADVDLAGAGCGDGGACAPFQLCHGGTCIPRSAPCRTDGDCQGDTYCDCAGTAVDGGCGDGVCVPWGVPPRGPFRTCGGFDLTIVWMGGAIGDAANLYCKDVSARICNRGDVAVTAPGGSFYERDPRAARSPRLLCTVNAKVAMLAPGECSVTEACANLDTGLGTQLPDVWFRANDDGKAFPAAPECDTGNDVARYHQNCTLP